MRESMFRDLNETEIECRVSQIKKGWLTLLLYKDARCDMNILDECVGEFNWKREHTRDNANCIVSVWDKDKKQWISKEDTGTQSNTEKEKGQASDSFKRACFNWGIGRELYTAPFIKIKPKNDGEFFENGSKFKTWSKFRVTDIEYVNKVIVYLEVADQDGFTRFTYGKPNPVTKVQLELINKVNLDETALNKWLKYYKVDELKDLTYKQAEFMIGKLVK